MVPRAQATIDSLMDERTRLERFARSLTETELTRAVPGSAWTVKDFIAHVATLDAAYVGWFTALAGGPDPGDHRGSPSFDVDRFNEAAVTERRGRSVDDLLREAVGRRARLPERGDDPDIVAWPDRPDVAASISAYQKAMG